MHITRAFCFAALLAFVAIEVNAQSERVKIIKRPNRELLRNVVFYRDSLLIATGSTSHGTYGGGHGVICSLDKNLIAKEFIQDGQGDLTLFHWSVLDGDTLVLFGSGYHTFVEGLPQATITKYVNGIPQNVFKFGGSKSDVFVRGFIVGNFYYGIGMTRSYCEDADTVWFSDVYACKVNRSGQLIWERTFGTPYMDEVKCAAITLDSSRILIGGYTYKDSLWFSENKALLLMIDTNGIQQWQRDSIFPYYDYEFIGSVNTDGSNGFLVGSTGKSYYPYLSRVDNNGTVEWIKHLHDDSLPANSIINKKWRWGFLRSVQRLRNGDILIAGTWDTYVWDDPRDAFVMRLNSQLDSIWRYEYHGHNDDEFFTTVEDNLGYIYASGYTEGDTTSSNPPSDILIVKLDAYGCAMDTCLMPEPPKPSPRQLPINANLFPNPFTNELQFNYYGTSFDQDIQLNVYDAVGRKTFSTKSIATRDAQTINTSSWSNGFYVVELQTNGLVERFKVVKQ